MCNAPSLIQVGDKRRLGVLDAYAESSVHVDCNAGAQVLAELRGDKQKCSGEANRALHLRDGGGIHSTADWSTPQEIEDIFKLLRCRWVKRIGEWRVVQRLRMHVSEKCSAPLLSDCEIGTLREDLRCFLVEAGFPCHTDIESGQPLALDLLRAVFLYTKDMDYLLYFSLFEGVSTGIPEAIPASGVWRAKESAEDVDVELLIHEAPWGSGLRDKAKLLQLVMEDVKQGFCEELVGGMDEAKRRFGAKIAAGKLGIVSVPGKEDRLIGDSSVSHANHKSKIFEKQEMLSLHDIAEFCNRHRDEKWMAFSLDISKAHKRVKVHPDEQGYSIFSVVCEDGATRWFVYKTCHFGCSWAAYWWSRVGAALVRIAHRFLYVKHFLGLFVDDALALFPSSVAPMLASLMIFLTCVLGYPLSWHKLQLDFHLKYIGWQLAFNTKCQASLSEDKADKLLALLRPMTRVGFEMSRKDLEMLVGLLGFVSCGARWLRPWLYDFYHLLHKPRLRHQQLDRAQLSELLSILDSDLFANSSAVLSSVAFGWRLIKVGSLAVHSKEELVSVPLRSGCAWATFSDIAADKVKVNKHEAGTAQFFVNAIKCGINVPFWSTAGPGEIAAADAFADDTGAGIGGFWLPAGAVLDPQNIIWFSCPLSKDSLPGWFCKNECGHVTLQSVVASLEALAQLVLLVLRARHMSSRPAHFGKIGIRQMCDNFGVVAASAKASSMKQPMCYVLQALSYFACKHDIQLHISYLAGEKNIWADALSRGSSKEPGFWKKLNPANCQQVSVIELLSEPWEDHL